MSFAANGCFSGNRTAVGSAMNAVTCTFGGSGCS
ncbi:hypothetical protein BJ998_008175 [Kutzneria kofuensis]|uniref:Uncharacterized protein n=1 Tax=Kutzneria kofuensis TaxID=103725 RepID=A0A7W9NLW4_9PSEU|nr:hypothetical protein [Kutzneria kofuensis]